MILIIAIDENKGINSSISEHFGHCPFFVIYDVDSRKLQIIKNEIDHSNVNMTPVDQIMKFKPNIIFSKGMGKRAIDLFNKKGVGVRTGNYKTVLEVINNMNNLNKLSEGCSY